MIPSFAARDLVDFARHREILSGSLFFKTKLQAFGRSDPETLQSQNHRRFKIPLLIKGLQVVHGQLVNVVGGGYIVHIRNPAMP
jgi:hypothetical protein